MIVIYPPDSTINFLEPILTKISPNIFKLYREDSSEKSFGTLTKFPNINVIIFLGHGNDVNLFGVDQNGIQEAQLHKNDAKEKFKNKKIICLSCKSSEYLSYIKEEFEVAIGFGNIITDKKEAINNVGDYVKYNYNDFKCIEIFRDRLVVLFANTMNDAFHYNLSFIQLFNLLRLRINKSICNSSLSSDKEERLAGELMFDLKKEMRLMGNFNALFNT
jgi:hypothetical protein